MATVIVLGIGVWLLYLTLQSIRLSNKYATIMEQLKAIDERMRNLRDRIGEVSETNKTVMGKYEIEINKMKELHINLASVADSLRDKLGKPKSGFQQLPIVDR